MSGSGEKGQLPTMQRHIGEEPPTLFQGSLVTFVVTSTTKSRPTCRNITTPFTSLISAQDRMLEALSPYIWQSEYTESLLACNNRSKCSSQYR
eukprot:424245-Amorphochlora_amoeboformis.AAC.1